MSGISSIELAAKMHDIGKISMPESIIDKATKLQLMIDGIELIKERHPSWIKQTIHNIKNFDTTLADYLDSCEISTKNEKISSLESVQNLMLNPIKNSSWGEEPDLLAQVEEDDIEQYFYQDMSFIYDSLTFLTDSTSKYGDFQIFRNKILNVIKKISQNGNKDQQIKMKKVLEYLKEELNG